MSQKYNTIKVLLRDEPFEKEAPLGSQSPYLAPVTPGMLVELEADGTCLPYATAADNPSPKRVAVEFGLDGRGVENAYAVEGEAVVYNIFQPGEEFYGLLEVGANVAAGAVLEPNGAGCLQAKSSGGGFRALEAVNNSAGSVPARIHVEVL